MRVWPQGRRQRAVAEGRKDRRDGEHGTVSVEPSMVSRFREDVTRRPEPGRSFWECGTQPAELLPGEFPFALFKVHRLLCGRAPVCPRLRVPARAYHQDAHALIALLT